MMGAKPVELIRLPDNVFTEEDRDYAASMFPEANVIYLRDYEAKMRRQGYVRRAVERPTSTLQEDADYTRRNLKAPEHWPECGV